MRMKPIYIVGLGGSLGQPSRSLAALQVALEGAVAEGAETRQFAVSELDFPMYRPGRRDVPLAVQEFCDAVYHADGMIWSSPLYHGTISGSFKNVLDWLQLLGDRDPPYLTNKVIGLVSTAGGMQGLQAVNTMEFIVRALRGWAVPLVVPVAQAWKVFDDDGEPHDARTEEQLRALGMEVAHAALHFATPVRPPQEVEQAMAEQQPIAENEVGA
jgi:FMN reductase